MNNKYLEKYDMLHYKGVITDQSGIEAKPIENTDKNLTETLLFYDD